MTEYLVEKSFTSHTEPSAKVLEMAGFKQYLEVYTDLETAIASF